MKHRQRSTLRNSTAARAPPVAFSAVPSGDNSTLNLVKCVPPDLSDCSYGYTMLPPQTKDNTVNMSPDMNSAPPAYKDVMKF